MKKYLTLLLMGIACLTLYGCGSSDATDSITVLNYGKYIESSVLDQFEDEYGIHVNYEEYESPEEMYTKYKAGSIDYDVMCTSEYIIQKLLQEDELLELDTSTMEHYSNLDEYYLSFSEVFDPGNKYSVPYFFGTVGILYNKNLVSEEEVKTWNVLWDSKYDGQIIMENSVRDTFMVPLKLKGHSLNTTNEDELQEALDLLIQQKPSVYAYFVDESSDEMIAENAAMALVYSGEAAAAMLSNENLGYSVPEEGSNMWIDSWFIPKTCTNQENAQKFIDFLCREDVAMKNFEYVRYATPNKAVYDALDAETQQDKTIFPDSEVLDNCEILSCLDDESTALYNDLWKQLKSN